MCHPCRCCGHGGTFNLAHYDLSVQMGMDKAARIAQTGAEAVITECSGCVLQLAEALGRLQPGIEVLTTAEAAWRYRPQVDGPPVEKDPSGD
jgi:glycolate oxidase iron-sulfur subunit